VTLVILAYVVGTQSADVLKTWNSSRHTDEYRSQAATQTAAILRRMGTIKVGDTLGDFFLEDIDGKVHRLSELVNTSAEKGGDVETARGGLVSTYKKATDRTLITYMKPDCDACLDELERLRSVADSPEDYEHVILITSANPLHMQRVREDYGLKCVILYDDERQFGAALKIQSFPFNLVVDHDRVIQEIIASVLLPEDYERLFEAPVTPRASVTPAKAGGPRQA
jgi:peroxiredoxin